MRLAWPIGGFLVVAAATIVLWTAATAAPAAELGPAVVVTGSTSARSPIAVDPTQGGPSTQGTGSSTQGTGSQRPGSSTRTAPPTAGSSTGSATTATTTPPPTTRTTTRSDPSTVHRSEATQTRGPEVITPQPSRLDDDGDDRDDHGDRDDDRDDHGDDPDLDDESDDDPDG